MVTTFDPDRHGRHVHDLRPFCPGDAELKRDVLCCIRNGEGPSVLLCGGIHGDEYEPQLVLRQLIDELDVDDVRGRLMIVPSINPPASQRGGRVSPVDGQNMNRVFPGRSDGTATERLAAFLHDRLFPSAELLVDVHSGGGDYRVVPMIFGFTAPGCAVDEARLETVMQGWGYPFIQYVKGIASTSAGSAPLAGVASVEIEGGGGGAMLASEIAIMRDGILRGLAAFGVLTRRQTGAASQPIRVDVGADDELKAPHDGLLEHKVALGQPVEAGDLVALLYPSSGATAEPTQMRAGRAGHVLRQRARAFVRKGELIGNTGAPR